MKKYIGTKQIEAEPMTMGEAYEKNLLQAGRVPNESEKDKAGYHVKYESGYESWSPAESFEKAYKVADTPLDRMSIEENELVDRVEKLHALFNIRACLHTCTYFAYGQLRWKVKTVVVQVYHSVLLLLC